MQDIQLYSHILGLSEPWRVKSVRLIPEASEIEVEVECTQKVWACGKCQERTHVQGWERRRWRQLDICQFKTWLAAEVPRVICEKHGSQTVPVPWAEKFTRFTRLFERLAIDVLRECSVNAASEMLRITWDEADGVKQRAVVRGMERKQAEAPARCIARRTLCGPTSMPQESMSPLPHSLTDQSHLHESPGFNPPENCTFGGSEDRRGEIPGAQPNPSDVSTPLSYARFKAGKERKAILRGLDTRFQFEDRQRTPPTPQQCHLPRGRIQQTNLVIAKLEKDLVRR